MTDLTRPPSLRAFLDSGGDLTTLRRLDLLVDRAAEIDIIPRTYAAGNVRSHRHLVESFLDGHDPIPTTQEREEGDLQDFVTFTAWEADLEEDRSLIPRLVERLPDELREEYARKNYLNRHQYPLLVHEESDGSGWTCGNCGVTHDTSDGVPHLTVSHQEGWTDEVEGLHYCASCIIMAADALRAEP